MLKRKSKLLLKSAGLRPIKHRGQNFLVSEEIIKKIIDSARIKNGETILEVGPGTGNLTEALLEAGASVVAIEKDRNLASLLKLKIKNQKSKIIEGDILKFDELALKPPYRVIANIPYYLTGALIQKFLLSPNQPSEMILMTQKEVGKRITARPPKANYLSSLVGFLAEPEILFGVKKENFWPQPQVDSVMIKLTPRQHTASLRSYARGKPEIAKIKKGRNDNNGNLKEFIKFLKTVFRQPRQTLFNNLRKSGTIPPGQLDATFEKLKLDKKIRPQNLNQENLIELFVSVT